MQEKRTLYLGLDPRNWPKEVVHYPVIRTERLDVNLEHGPAFTHVIFTSRRAVHYFWELGLPLEQKTVLSIGEATAAELRCPSRIAPEPTQEGIIALLDTLDLTQAYFLLPRSQRARDLLPHYLERKNIPFVSLALYDTFFQKPEPLPDLSHFDEIVFTSPSTVEGFIQIFGSFPTHCKLTAIGPITESALTKMLSQDTIV